MAKVHFCRHEKGKYVKPLCGLSNRSVEHVTSKAAEVTCRNCLAKLEKKKNE